MVLLPQGLCTEKTCFLVVCYPLVDDFFLFLFFLFSFLLVRRNNNLCGFGPKRILSQGRDPLSNVCYKYGIQSRPSLLLSSQAEGLVLLECLLSLSPPAEDFLKRLDKIIVDRTVSTKQGEQLGAI